jgi:serine protease inhibitor ecotin
MIYAFAENCGYVLYRCVNPLLQRHKKLLVGLPLLLFVLCLMGCQRLEIEERSFPLAMAVTSGEGEGLYEFSFFFEENDSDASNRKNTTVQAAGYPEAFALFERSQAGQVDTSHMQVILLQEELLEDTEFLEGLYGALIREQHFSWNTLVYLLDDDSMDAETLAACTDGRPGSYLRQVAESSGDQPVLGDLYMEWNNREQTLLLPVLSGKAAMADHYRLLIHGELGECLPADEAGLSVSAPLS